MARQFVLVTCTVLAISFWMADNAIAQGQVFGRLRGRNPTHFRGSPLSRLRAVSQSLRKSPFVRAENPNASEDDEQSHAGTVRKSPFARMGSSSDSLDYVVHPAHVPQEIKTPELLPELIGYYNEDGSIHSFHRDRSRRETQSEEISPNEEAHGKAAVKHRLTRRNHRKRDLSAEITASMEERRFQRPAWKRLVLDNEIPRNSLERVIVTRGWTDIVYPNMSPTLQGLYNDDGTIDELLQPIDAYDRDETSERIDNLEVDKKYVAFRPEHQKRDLDASVEKTLDQKEVTDAESGIMLNEEENVTPVESDEEADELVGAGHIDETTDEMSSDGPSVSIEETPEETEQIASKESVKPMEHQVFRPEHQKRDLDASLEMEQKQHEASTVSDVEKEDEHESEENVTDEIQQQKTFESTVSHAEEEDVFASEENVQPIEHQAFRPEHHKRDLESSEETEQKQTDRQATEDNRIEPEQSEDSDWTDAEDNSSDEQPKVIGFYNRDGTIDKLAAALPFHSIVEACNEEFFPIQESSVEYKLSLAQGAYRPEHQKRDSPASEETDSFLVSEANMIEKHDDEEDEYLGPMLMGVYNDDGTIDKLIPEFRFAPEAEESSEGVHSVSLESGGRRRMSLRLRTFRPENIKREISAEKIDNREVVPVTEDVDEGDIVAEAEKSEDMHSGESSIVQSHIHEDSPSQHDDDIQIMVHSPFETEDIHRPELLPTIVGYFNEDSSIDPILDDTVRASASGESGDSDPIVGGKHKKHRKKHRMQHMQHTHQHYHHYGNYHYGNYYGNRGHYGHRGHYGNRGHYGYSRPHSQYGHGGNYYRYKRSLSDSVPLTAGASFQELNNDPKSAHVPSSVSSTNTSHDHQPNNARESSDLHSESDGRPRTARNSNAIPDTPDPQDVTLVKFIGSNGSEMVSPYQLVGHHRAEHRKPGGIVNYNFFHLGCANDADIKENFSQLPHRIEKRKGADPDCVASNSQDQVTESPCPTKRRQSKLCRNKHLFKRKLKQWSLKHMNNTNEEMQQTESAVNSVAVCFSSTTDSTLGMDGGVNRCRDVRKCNPSDDTSSKEQFRKRLRRLRLFPQRRDQLMNCLFSGKVTSVKPAIEIQKRESDTEPAPAQTLAAIEDRKVMRNMKTRRQESLLPRFMKPRRTTMVPLTTSTSTTTISTTTTTTEAPTTTTTTTTSTEKPLRKRVRFRLRSKKSIPDSEYTRNNVVPEDESQETDPAKRVAQRRAWRRQARINKAMLRKLIHSFNSPKVSTEREVQSSTKADNWKDVFAVKPQQTARSSSRKSLDIHKSLKPTVQPTLQLNRVQSLMHQQSATRKTSTTTKKHVTTIPSTTPRSKPKTTLPRKADSIEYSFEDSQEVQQERSHPKRSLDGSLDDRRRRRSRSGRHRQRIESHLDVSSPNRGSSLTPGMQDFIVKTVKEHCAKNDNPVLGGVPAQLLKNGVPKLNEFVEAVQQRTKNAATKPTPKSETVATPKSTCVPRERSTRTSGTIADSFASSPLRTLFKLDLFKPWRNMITGQKS
ncbi:uncharacterized protein LOC129728987 [Wyeomyia smithii]|uniref:uncharacterized protein LOC129728987 n=1 Tax=Wyeomyia smithii TaxID=174621 RepID=UPI002467B062|nr:uncharacterized protein LOC129728987 [Wyeomyia smithii]